MVGLINTGPSSYGWSYWGTFSRCPRLFFKKWRLKDEGKPRTAPGLGSVVHAGLAHHYQAAAGVNSGVSLVDVVHAESASRGLTDGDRELALDILGHYAVRFATERFRPIFAEEEKRVGFMMRGDGRCVPVYLDPNLPLPKPPTNREIHVGEVVPYTGRVDLGLEDESGKVWYIDHKTAAYIRDSTSRRYSIHGQIHGMYHLGYANERLNFAGVMLTLIQTRAGKKFERVKPLPAYRAVDNFPRLILTLNAQINYWDQMAGMNEGGWPMRTHEQVCISSYGECDYLDNCLTGG